MQIEFFSFCVTFIIGFYGNTLHWKIYEWLFRFFMEKYEPPIGLMCIGRYWHERPTTYILDAIIMRMVTIYLCNYLFSYFNITLT